MSEGVRTVIKHPNSAYFMVAFLVLCCTAVVRTPVLALVYLIPVLVMGYLVRTATVVDDRGITARALLGSQHVSWEELRGVRLTDQGAVYAVATDGTQLKLPCLRAGNLAPLVTASGGRVPDLAG
jgi:hypothetical protein